MENARKRRHAAYAAGAVGVALLCAPVALAAPLPVGPTEGGSAAATAALQDALGGGSAVAPVGVAVDPLGSVAARSIGTLPGGLAAHLGLMGLPHRDPVLGVLQQVLAQAGFPAGAPALAGVAQGLSGAGPMTAAPPPDPLDAAATHLAIGSTGPAVVALENTLADWGYPSPDDGQFTVATAARVTAASARAGARSGNLSARLAQIGFGPQAPVLMPGGRGPQVAALQRALARAGYPVGAVGRFGPQTEAQVQAFQLAHGLEANGHVTLWQVERAAEEADAWRHAHAAAVARATDQTLDARAALVASARRLVGDRYAWGGDGPWAFDCSGLVRYVFQHATGIWLPHSSYIQWLHGRYVAEGNLEPGDLVFFDTDGFGPSHVGVYVGGAGDEFVDATDPARGVRVDSMENPYWARHFIGGRSIL